MNSKPRFQTVEVPTLLKESNVIAGADVVALALVANAVAAIKETKNFLIMMKQVGIVVDG